MSTPKLTEKNGKLVQKDFKKQETMDDLPEEQVSPPPRTAVMLLEAYPDKMIQIHEQLEHEEQTAKEAELARSSVDIDPKKGGRSTIQESQLINNKSQMATHNASHHPEDEKTKRKDSSDVKHLENEPLHFCYTQNKNVLHIDASKSADEIQQMIDDHPDGYHITFWVYFESIKYDAPSRFKD